MYYWCSIILNSNKACNAALQQKTKKIRISPYENQFVIKCLTFTNHFFFLMLIGCFVDCKMQMNGQGISKQFFYGDN